MRILLVGHSCGPGRGSEPGTTWNLAWQLSADHEVWLLTHPQYETDVDAYLKEHPRPNLHFVYVLPKKWDPWKWRQGERGLKLHYLLWQHAAASKGAELCARMKFDIAHHVSLGTINAPPVLHKLPLPIVWGPLGGGQTMPPGFSDYFRGHLTAERARIAMAKMLPLFPSLRRFARRCQLVLGKNLETQKLAEKAGAKRTAFYLDCGLPSGYVPDSIPPRAWDGTIKLLWGGRLEPRKGLRLGLEALAKVQVPVKLMVAGDGPEKPAMETLARSLNVVDRVQFLGNVPWPRMKELFGECHAFYFTSLRDSTGCVVLEAMGHGLPIVTLDHQGVHSFVPVSAGIKVPVTTPAEVIQGLAEGIDRLSRDTATRQAMSDAALAHAKTQTWDCHREDYLRFYQEAIDDYARQS